MPGTSHDCHSNDNGESFYVPGTRQHEEGQCGFEATTYPRTCATQVTNRGYYVLHMSRSCPACFCARMNLENQRKNKNRLQDGVVLREKHWDEERAKERSTRVTS